MTAAAVLLLPVVLLPLTTAVPIRVWLVLLLVALIVVVWLVIRRRQRFVQPAGMGLLAISEAAAVIASHVLTSTAPITGQDGRPLPGSIAGVEEVELNGSEQWIMVRGNDASNPVLLNLGMGGPGRGGFFNAVEFRPLEEHFTVVSWDEPGTGKSYGALPFNELNKERYAADAVALTNVLRERFGQQKIFLYGVAWSSILGIWLTHEHPDLYHAFVSSGQMVNTTENDRLGYELALWHVEDQGDARHAEELRRNGPPPYQGDNVVSPYVAFLDVLNEIMGTPRFSLIVPVSGLIESFNVVYPQLEGLDFKVQAPELLVPVYFFVGRLDVNAMASLVEEYYNSLSAPDKKLIWLEGGHGLASADNQNAFIDEMITHVRPLSRRWWRRQASHYPLNVGGSQGGTSRRRMPYDCGCQLPMARLDSDSESL